MNRSDIESASRRIGDGNRAFLRETPLWRLPGSALEIGCAEVWLKLEHLQVGGSFKARGMLNRLREVARKLGTESYMVDSADELLPAWFEGKQRVGLTAGASAPDILVRQVIERIKALGAVSVRTMQGIEETVKFPLPKGLRLDGPNDAVPEHLR